MANLTLRNIPDNLLERIRSLSNAERRSLNSEILVLLERSLREYTAEKRHDVISTEAQLELWSKLAGEWEDPRSTDEIIADILSHRTPGREVKL
jgi:plasmid stability protein